MFYNRSMIFTEPEFSSRRSPVLATVGCEAVPVVALLAHADTAPDFSGTNVKPIVHHNYQGGALRLPDDAEQVIDPADARHANFE